MKLFSDSPECCGCMTCMNLCPKSAIIMEPDEKGFPYPKIDLERCVKCGLCEKCCPMKRKLSFQNTTPLPVFYAVKHRSDKVRMQSSSGGMFTAVSDYVLRQGGTVYGAAFNNDFSVSHRRAENTRERNLLRGSKYVQSDLGHTFLQVKTDLASGIPVLFSGTPCQVAGLRLFLLQKKICTDRLYLCDLVCHGVPSSKIFQDYLSALQAKFHSEIRSIAFRYKPAGWRAQAVKINFYNGATYQSAAFNDPYYRLFLSNVILRNSCYCCPFANLRRTSDLTIGDFWGIEKTMPEFEDKKGVSLVLVNTEKGRQLFQAVKPMLEIRFLRSKQGMQPNLNKPSIPSPKTDAFWLDYQTHGFKFVARKYAGAGLKGSMKRSAKNILKRLGIFGVAKKLLQRY